METQRHGDTEDLNSETIEGLNEITARIIAAAIEVHRTLGPGLLEASTRKRCASNCGFEASNMPGKYPWWLRTKDSRQDITVLT